LVTKIALGLPFSDYNNKFKTLSKMPFPLKKAILRKKTIDLLKLPTLICVPVEGCTMYNINLIVKIK
jgi:hypothetical protein